MNTGRDSANSLTYKLQLENYYTFSILNDEGGGKKSKKIENFLQTWVPRTDVNTAQCHNMSSHWRVDTPETVIFGGSLGIMTER